MLTTVCCLLSVWLLADSLMANPEVRPALTKADQMVGVLDNPEQVGVTDIPQVLDFLADL
jgi:hypothetical protein